MKKTAIPFLLYFALAFGLANCAPKKESSKQALPTTQEVAQKEQEKQDNNADDAAKAEHGVSENHEQNAANIQQAVLSDGTTVVVAKKVSNDTTSQILTDKNIDKNTDKNNKAAQENSAPSAGTTTSTLMATNNTGYNPMLLVGLDNQVQKYPPAVIDPADKSPLAIRMTAVPLNDSTDFNDLSLQKYFDLRKIQKYSFDDITNTIREDHTWIKFEDSLFVDFNPNVEKGFADVKKDDSQLRQKMLAAVWNAFLSSLKNENGQCKLDLKLIDEPKNIFPLKDANQNLKTVPFEAKDFTTVERTKLFSSQIVELQGTRIYVYAWDHEVENGLIIKAVDSDGKAVDMPTTFNLQRWSLACPDTAGNMKVEKQGDSFTFFFDFYQNKKPEVLTPGFHVINYLISLSSSQVADDWRQEDGVNTRQAPPPAGARNGN